VLLMVLGQLMQEWLAWVVVVLGSVSTCDSMRQIDRSLRSKERGRDGAVTAEK
jgi:hypothetical protein